MKSLKRPTLLLLAMCLSSSAYAEPADDSICYLAEHPPALLADSHSAFAGKVSRKLEPYSLAEEVTLKNGQTLRVESGGCEMHYQKKFTFENVPDRTDLTNRIHYIEAAIKLLKLKYGPKSYSLDEDAAELLRRMLKKSRKSQPESMTSSCDVTTVRKSESRVNITIDCSFPA